MSKKPLAYMILSDYYTKQKPRYTIRVPELGGSCTEPDVESALAHIETLLSEGSPGDKFTVEVVEMSDDAYHKMPQFMGW